MRPPLIRWTAKHIRREIKDGVAQLEFTNAVFDYTRYLTLQKPLRPSDQDVRLGQDAPYLEVDDQKYSTYSRSIKAEVSTDSVRFLLDSAASSALAGTSEIVIDLDAKLDRARTTGLKAQLGVLLGPENVGSVNSKGADGP